MNQKKYCRWFFVRLLVLNSLVCTGYSTDQISDGEFLAEPRILSILPQAAKRIQLNFDQDMSADGLDVVANYAIKQADGAVLGVTSVSIIPGIGNRAVFIDTDA